MIRFFRLAAVLVVACPAFAAGAGTAVDPKYAWNLNELYPGEAAWAEALGGAVADVPKIDAMETILKKRGR